MLSQQLNYLYLFNKTCFTHSYAIAISICFVDKPDQKIKIICKKIATFKKKQGDFNFA